MIWLDVIMNVGIVSDIYTKTCPTQTYVQYEHTKSEKCQYFIGQKYTILPIRQEMCKMGYTMFVCLHVMSCLIEKLTGILSYKKFGFFYAFYKI
jgi:hypothetical protein